VTKRPNKTNERDACSACGALLPTPSDHEDPAEGELEVWQPNPGDPPQWICAPCARRLEGDQ